MKIPPISEAYINDLKEQTKQFQILRELTFAVRELGFDYSSYWSDPSGLTYGDVQDRQYYMCFLRGNINGSSYYFEFDPNDIAIHSQVLEYAKEWKELFDAQNYN